MSETRKHKRNYYVLAGIMTAAMLLFVPLAGGATGDPLIAGAFNTADQPTYLFGSANGPFFHVQNSGIGSGIRAVAGNVGVDGESPTSIGVLGITQGSSPIDSPEPNSASVGVAGISVNPDGGTAMAATALNGNNAAVSHNDAFVATVMGQGATGTAIRAEAPGNNATALSVSGLSRFSTTGQVQIPQGKSRVTVAQTEPRYEFLRTLSGSDTILVTLQDNPNATGKKVRPVWFSHVEKHVDDVPPNERSFDIVLTGPVTNPHGVPAMFFVISNWEG